MAKVTPAYPGQAPLRGSGSVKVDSLQRLGNNQLSLSDSEGRALLDATGPMGGCDFDLITDKGEVFKACRITRMPNPTILHYMS